MNYQLLDDTITEDIYYKQTTDNHTPPFDDQTLDNQSLDNVDLFDNNYFPNIHFDISTLVDKSISIRWIHKHATNINKDITNFIYFFIFIINLLSSSYLIWYDEFTNPTKKDLGIFVVFGSNIFISLILIMLKSTHNDIENYVLYYNEWNHLINSMQRIHNLYIISDTNNYSPPDITYFNEKYFDLIRNQKFNYQSIKEFKKQFRLSGDYVGIIQNKDIIDTVLNDIKNYNKI